MNNMKDFGLRKPRIRKENCKEFRMIRLIIKEKLNSYRNNWQLKKLNLNRILKIFKINLTKKKVSLRIYRKNYKNAF